MQSTSFHGVSEESFVQFRRRVEEDLAVWEGTVLDANSFLDSYKYHSTHGKRVSLVQLTATDVQVVAGVRPEEEEEGLKFWASRYVLGCSGRIEVLRMILEDFSNGVPGMRPHEVAYMLFNFDDSPISRPADRDACNAYLNESLGPDMVAAYLAKKGDYFFAAAWPGHARRADYLSLKGAELFPGPSHALARPLRSPPAALVLGLLQSQHGLLRHHTVEREDPQDHVAWFFDCPASSCGLVVGGEAQRHRRQCGQGRISLSGSVIQESRDPRHGRVLVLEAARVDWGVSGVAVARTGIFRDVLINEAVAGRDYDFFLANEKSFNDVMDKLMRDDGH
eukprot:CAMPEP_0176013480 /NCGR_PEP_ID=MMETSP0120_2-20121206/6329_1 /TAXON_ID=160619 /ORGANISM="Kryptoperidinium foliaceum, Strain CCMP 1326" /LENGTH=335 /DNA_ID=CAMNT_0017346391 /DNA_START=42 /DNA_END=1046 /DNA_ORIENTATION=+